jgi:hypothetical protein
VAGNEFRRYTLLFGDDGHVYHLEFDKEQENHLEICRTSSRVRVAGHVDSHENPLSRAYELNASTINSFWGPNHFIFRVKQIEKQGVHFARCFVLTADHAA